MSQRTFVFVSLSLASVTVVAMLMESALFRY